MDVRKLALALCVVILLAVAVVLVLRQDAERPGRPANDRTIADQVEARHGPTLRAAGIRSLSVDPRSDDVMVVFNSGGRLGRRVAGRLPGLAAADACGELDVGFSVGESITAWGNGRSPDFMPRLDCVIDKVVEQAADLRGGD